MAHVCPESKVVLLCQCDQCRLQWTVPYSDFGGTKSIAEAYRGQGELRFVSD